MNYHHQIERRVWGCCRFMVAP